MIAEIFLSLLILIFSYMYFYGKPKGMPPGEWGLPIIGKMPSLDVLLTDQVDVYRKKYGKIFVWKMGSRRMVFLCDYQNVKTAFALPSTSHRPTVFSLDIFSDYKKLGFANSCARPLINLRRFSLRYLKDHGMGKTSLEDVILFELECLISDFKKFTDKPVEIPWSLNVAVINTLWKLLADKRYDVDDKEIQDYERLVTDVFNDAQGKLVLMLDLFPFLVPLIPDFLKRKLGLEGTFNHIVEYQAFFKAAIDRHIKTLNVEEPRDYMDQFLIEMKKNEGESKNEKTDTFSYAELLFALSDMFGAGSETVSSTIRWMFLFMAKYPECQRKAQKEIDDAVPRERLPNLNDKDKLVYTQAIMDEAMRLTPISPFGIQHYTSEDIMIGGYRIPKDTIIVSSIRSCHYDPDYWENPEEFKPERFINADGSLDTKKEGFLAFSTGRRVCPGESLARAEMFLFLAGLLQKFSFSAAPGEKLETSPNLEKPIFNIPNPFKLIISERVENK